jgi:hypothetical protein
MRVLRNAVQDYPIQDFSAGIVTDVDKPVAGELKVAENVRLSPKSSIRKRGGSQQVVMPSETTFCQDGIKSFLETEALGTFVACNNVAGRWSIDVLTRASTGLSYTSSVNIKSSSLGEPSDFVRFIEFQDKVYYCSGTELFWSDGVNNYKLGIPEPSVDPTFTQSTTGGSMVPGDYIFSYAYARSGEYSFTGLGSNVISVTVPDGTETNKVTVTVTASNDAEINADKIHLFRTRAGATAFYKVAEVSNPNDGSSVDIDSTISDEEILADNLYDEENTPPPERVIDIAVASNRMFYATEKKVYYSDLGLPEAVDGDNYHDIDPGNKGKIVAIYPVLSYVLILKENSTHIMSAASPDAVPKKLDDIVGCVSRATVKTIKNGQAVIWLSKTGFATTDSQSVVNVSEGRNQDELIRQRREADLSKTFSEFSPTSGCYYTFVPYLGGTHKIWVFDTTNNVAAFTTDRFTFVPSFFSLLTDGDGKQRLATGYIDSENKPVIVEAERGDNMDNSGPIKMTVELRYFDVGTPELDKKAKRITTEWYSSAPTTATISLGVNGTNNQSLNVIKHKGAVSFDDSAIGFDVEGQGFDSSGNEYDVSRVFGIGRSFNIGFVENSTADVSILTLSVGVVAVGKRTEYRGSDS